MAQPYDDLFGERVDRSRRISPVTRRDIFDYVRTEGGPWWGRMSEIAFLGRLYDLEALPSSDARYATASRDIHQHRVNNFDWDDDWVFHDSRFKLASGSDEVLLMRQTLTWDRGVEMTRHAEFTAAPGVPVFFCDAYCPWQRGSNENTNGLLRQYFPKKTVLPSSNPHELAAVVYEINNRPRRTLGWKTAHEVFHGTDVAMIA